MKFGTGYLADPAGCRPTFGHLARRLGAAPLPAQASVLDRAPAPLNQGQTSACTGHAVACGLHIALGLEWVPSPAEIYRNGRAIDRYPGPDGVWPPLVDGGASPSQVLRGVNNYGIRPMVALPDRYSDVDPATVNAEPLLGDLETEALALIVGDYAIESDGGQRSYDVALALSAGKPVTVGVPGGSDAWQGYAGGVLGALTSPIDHYAVLVGYATVGDGRRVFTIRNSWSASWGEAGNVRVSEDALASFGDLIALDVRKV